MTKAVTYLPTLLFLLLPFASEGFNFSLSFGAPETKTGCCSAHERHCSRHHSRDLEGALSAVSFGFGTRLSAAVGKVIKQSIIGEEDYRIKTIVIDPGHGGHDPGCLGGNSQEKHIALAVSLRLAKLLRSNYPELEVILTRDSDVFIPLHERAAIANRNSADLFISVHCNYMPGSSATRGSETYVMGLHTAEHNLKVAKRENAAILLEDNYERNYDYDPNSPEGHIMLSMFQSAFLEQSILFAEKVEEHFARARRKSRGVKQAGFVVLKETTMPSVLVETGFLSNRAEEAYLMTEQGQSVVAYAMLDAFEEYRRELEGSPLAQPMPAVPRPDTPDKVLPIAEQPERPAKREEPPLAKGRYLVARKSSSEAESEPASWATSPASSNVRQAAARSAEELGITYCIQLAASPRPVDTSHPRWSNTGYMIEVVREDQLFKYQARNFTSLQQAFEARLLLQNRGFPDAFIVAYRAGGRISLEEARRLTGHP